MSATMDTASRTRGPAPGEVVRARSPLRISFGGGGTDVSPYCDERGGAVLSATIDRWAYATVAPAEGFEVSSVDYDMSVRYSLDEEFIYDGQLDLAKAVIDHFRRELGLSDGLRIRLHNDAPPGSGLGSSSAIVVAMVGAIAHRLGRHMDPYEVAERAFRIEREEAGIKGGRQDQYATAFGGFNFIEFERGSTVVSPLRLRSETLWELEYRLVFAYVGGAHFSSHIIEAQSRNFERKQADAVAAMDRIKEIADEMRRALLLGHMAEFGSLLDQGWMAKKRMAEGISNPRIDEIYEKARDAGALGGKISGAGGGGFMFFVAEPQRRFAVQQALRDAGSDVVNFTFVQEGMRSWSV